MPFMIGLEPVRRTVQYLNTGKLILKNSIQIFSINYNSKDDHHQGIRDFIFWDVPHIQYKNPTVQMVLLKNMTPSPFIRCFYDNGQRMLIDVDSKGRNEILAHLIKVIGKSAQVLKQESMDIQKTINPANIGNGCVKHCICEVPGQLPCPSIVPLPYHMRGKYTISQHDLPEPR